MARKYTFQELESLWKQAGGNPVYAAMAAAVALAESGGDPSATNRNTDGSVDRGLWQINSVHAGQSTTDPLRNARAAVAISNNGTSWRPWCVAWSSGRCSGTFLGAGSPVLEHLPAGSPTGNTPTGQISTGAITPASRAVLAAMSQIGVPYKYGAEEAGKDFDCSGLVQYAYSKAGITLPRTAAAQQNATTRVAPSELRPGDLVFWGAPAHHVAIYIGGGRIIQAPQTGQLVENVKVWGSPTNYGRVRGAGAQNGASTPEAQMSGLGGGIADTGLFDSLNPMNALVTGLKDIENSFLAWLLSGVEIIVGIAMIGFGIMLAILSTKTAEDKGKEIAGVIVASKTGRSSSPSTPSAPSPPVDEPKRPAVRAEVVTPRRRTDRLAVEPARPKVIEGKVVDG